MQNAKSAYKSGDLPGAKKILEDNEAEAMAGEECQRIEYALYRGLTYVGLGDKTRGTVWLTRAQSEDDHLFKARLKQCLGKDDLSRLELGLDAVR
jgi:hypothetical protein